MSFNEMLARIQQKNAVKELVSKVQSNYVADPRYWAPTFAKSKDGREEAKALVRFLPAPDGETEDFVKFFTHYIRGQNNAWYFEKCRTTLQQRDPAEELAKRLGANDKATYLRYGRTPRFVANILVIQDANKPENNGKVLLFEFGNKIMKKLTAMLIGSDDPIDPRDPVNFLDPLEGANFKIAVCKQGGQNNYDDCTFMQPGQPLYGGDLSKIEAIWKTAHPLQPLVAPENFKSYEELSRLLSQVVGPDVMGSATSIESTESVAAVAQKPRAVTSEPSAAPKAAPKHKDEDSDDPDLIFADLLEGTDSLSGDDAVDALFK